MTSAAGSDPALSHDAHYLATTARFYGWDTACEPGGGIRMTYRDWALDLVFTHDGQFQFARASGPDSTDLELELPQVLDALEEYGSAVHPQPS